MKLQVRGTVELLADRIRQEILSGALPPGQAIRQEEMAERFGISRSPLREALRQLEAEHLIYYRPNKGAVVASFDRETLRAIFEVRRILESGAIELVIAKLTDAKLATLRKLERAIHAKTGAGFIAAHRAFHEAVYAVAGNNQLAKVLFAHSVRVARLPNQADVTRVMRRTSKGDHGALLDALANRDVRAARRATLAHLDHIEGAMLGALKPTDA